MGIGDPIGTLTSGQNYAILQEALQKRKSGLSNFTPQEREILDWYDKGAANPTPQTDPFGKLVEADREYENAGAFGMSSAEADAKKQGTYADTPAFKTALGAESQRRVAGIKNTTLARQNELRKQLGLGELAP